MSLHTLLAHEVRSKGRGDDTMLIHMTPQEVGGLQALAMAHGGSLSINPDTGLPEAGFLKNILPALVGFGLNFFLPGVGTAVGSALGGLSGAAGTGIAVGGIEALRTGDISKGLTAGLGAFGGANLGAGASAAANASNVATPATGAFDAAQGLNAMSGGTGAVVPSGFDAFIGQAADKATGTAATGLGGGIGAAKTVGALATQVPPPTMKFEKSEDPYANYEGPYTPTQRNVYFPDENAPRTSREFTYFDPSNPVPFAEGGLTAFAKGRFLEGPGDGTSDDIPAVIGSRQPARLADGEFVIDARTVSEIGNGSSKAGAKKLYAMMDRVHNERKKAQRGKDSNADKHLPA